MRLYEMIYDIYFITLSYYFGTFLYPHYSNITKNEFNMTQNVICKGSFDYEF